MSAMRPRDIGSSAPRCGHGSFTSDSSARRHVAARPLNRIWPFHVRRTLVKKIVFGVAAAVVLGLASFSGPASAAPVQSGVIAPITDVSAARYVVRKTVVRRGPVCTVRKVVRRGPMGRRVVSTTRVCR
jgi:hypothetical protein